MLRTVDLAHARRLLPTAMPPTENRLRTHKKFAVWLTQ